MISRLIVAILTITPLISVGQNNSAGVVYYQFKHQKDTTQPDRFYQEEMMLHFSSSSSLYKSYTWYKDDSASTAGIYQGKTELPVIKLSKYSFESWYTVFEKKELYRFQPFIYDTMAIKAEYPTIAWQLQTEQKKISGFLANKAIGQFKGRTYEVWYTPEIPVAAGPWKLNGLPGLILEAYDTKRQVVFEFLGFQNTKVDSRDLLKGKRILTSSEFNDFGKKLVANPNGVVQGIMGTSTQVNFQKTGNGSDGSRINGSRNNNPLELTN
ncbi:MAG: GLPGLI family protein [Bacteroidetes bacterium]|nr:MAG: GLPGLI family protein [Bacteroidota bacterium]TAE61039.1 MAG: GLPGLI family protein [Bacteroidota bacterium]TAF98531.1 MAG: GLPGLI family protein [Bacteroidota bacterium]